MELNINQIKEILPHRYPLLLVDRILEIEPMKRAVGLKNMTGNEMVFNGHFPENPVFPGVLLIEAMAQVGGISVLYCEEHRGKMPIFAKIDNARFRRQVVPGDQFITTAEVVKIVRNRIVHIHFVGTVNGEVAAEADGTFSLIPVEEQK